MANPSVVTLRLTRAWEHCARCASEGTPIAEDPFLRTARGSCTRPASAVWSPDGKRIAAAVGERGRIVIIDAADPTRRRKLGKEDGPLVWSPDSRYLLQLRSQFSCIPTVFGESLEIIDTFTGERSLVKSSHCQIIRGATAWLD